MNARIYGNAGLVKAKVAGLIRRENPKSIMAH
jgi:hypothetical protein